MIPTIIQEGATALPLFQLFPVLAIVVQGKLAVWLINMSLLVLSNIKPVVFQPALTKITDHERRNE